MEADTKSPRRMVVVGRGLIAAGAAVTLAQGLKKDRMRVTWIQYGPPDHPGAEITDPAFGRWLALIGYPERALLNACDGCYSLGVDYHSGGREAFVPYGSHGIAPSPAPFEQEFFCRFRREEQLAFNDHFLATQAARRGRFDFPVEDPRSVKSTLRYGLHLDRARLTDVLTRFARDKGVDCIATDTCTPHFQSNGDITRVTLGEGRDVRGDFYVDTSGALTPGSDSESTPDTWGYRVLYSERLESPARPCSTMTRKCWGWLRRAGLSDRSEIDAWVADDTGLSTLLSSLKETGQAPTVLARRAPNRNNAWQGNCLSLGRTAGWPGDPLLSEWHWACQSLLLWLELYPGGFSRPHLRTEFNRRHGLLFQAQQELSAMHRGDPGDDESDSLRWTRDVFERFGRRWRRDEEPLPDETWFALVLALGWSASGCDITVLRQSPERLAEKHHRIMRTLEQAAEGLPTLDKVIARANGQNNSE